MALVRQHLSFANVVALTALVVALSGGAYAAVSSESGSNTLTACIKKGTYVTVKKGKCPKGQRKVSWNKEGPAGPAGAKGEPGAAGLAGAAGAVGPTGPTGAAGLAGASARFQSVTDAGPLSTSSSTPVSLGTTINSVEVGSSGLAEVMANATITPSGIGTNATMHLYIDGSPENTLGCDSVVTDGLLLIKTNGTAETNQRLTFSGSCSSQNADDTPLGAIYASASPGTHDFELRYATSSGTAQFTDIGFWVAGR